ncbi:synaptojanin (N-terminal domain) [Trypanosoma grayi]|uniref:synaptojanin (N-terminal domain) n=1 Tax=Trypanosoma grayi TaxID=71804 RepID=UPI0004F46DB1|nr:synaptojanin (N-terminal domain) [Trypanosoma grayi]KEG14814.1 synaptojanin (N-terminal domain) [Trypanosoma grayi]
MFFNDDPLPEPQSCAEVTTAVTNIWAGGWFVSPLIVNANAEVEMCRAFDRTKFSSFKEAYNVCGPFESIVEYPAMFGCILLDKVYFLVATRVEEVAGLPFGGTILRVAETEWIAFNIPGAAPLRMSVTDKNRLREFQQYKYEKGYYYSDDCDLTKPFPFISSRAGDSPEFHCDWSEHLRQAFRLNGLDNGCSVLIRGYAEGKNIEIKDRSVLCMLLLGRQNHLNPGPRYLGRGLNGNNAVGNDHVYEYVMWRKNADGSISFARHTILRGTIPVQWTTQINATIAEPSMIFSPNKEEVLQGCDVYFESLFRQLTALIKYDTGGAPVDAIPKVRCINLLRQNPQSGEGILARYFIEAVRKADAAVRRVFPKDHLDLVHVDWLNLIKDYGIDVATKTFWEAVLAFLAPSSSDALATVGSVRPDGSVSRLLCQRQFVRINCADSLDRTNLGCFFTCFQASVFMLGSLGIQLNSFVDQRPLPPLDGQDDFERDGFSAFLAPMAGAKSSFPKPFVGSWYEARNPSLYPVAVGRALSELFVYNGDIVAQLYTNSAAMHSNILRGICGLKYTTSNVVIATQRRFENVFEDRKKFRSIELLLGRNKDIHFPSMSRVFLTRPVPWEHWKCALVAVGVPPGISSSELEGSVRRAWDEMVCPMLCNDGYPPIASSALCFTVTVAEDEVESHTEFVTALGHVTFEQTPPLDEDSCVPQENEQIAVIEFDRDLCRAINVPRLLQERAVLKFQSSNVILTPYEYPVQGSEGDSSGLVHKAANSLRSGLKNFVRGLNV